ncbi:MAG TPA: Wzz/FepE/Etk N-terminal domain-containing protein [Paracoccaceae bacterium]|nr:Wzz/FepE/Etk N-terminal domain-containing protein [Paracoccaceae bacterium]HMO72375.1 Wzz/FepE/Etk N-terminal domain-containing protein [Paracoccaceae bacterium]
MGQIQTLEELFGLLWRRRLAIVAVAFFGIALSVTYALSRGVTFESSAVIQVESPTVGIAGDPGMGSAQRLQAIQQRLTTRENLLVMIERHGLFTGLALTQDEKVHALRSSIRFDPVASAAPVVYGSPPQLSAVIVSARAETAELAARIANDFAQSVLDAGAERQAGRAQDTLDFFKTEERRLAAEIAALEAEVAAYAAGNARALPAWRDLLRDDLAGIETELRAIDAAIAAAQAERRRIEEAGAQRQVERRQIGVLATEIATLGARRETLADQRGSLMADMARIPEIEQQLAGFARLQNQLQSRHGAVMARLAEADTAAKLEDLRKAERFTLLERATIPDYPATGMRRRLALWGTMISLLAGVVVAFLLDTLKPVVRTTGQMQRQVGLRPIVAIPDMPRRPRAG